MINNFKIIAKFQGKVVYGFGRGKELGFPTANLDLIDVEIKLPKEGVYACIVKILDSKEEPNNYFASCNLGRALTFGATKITIEPHLINFSGNLYGKILEVSLLKYLRGMQKFETVKDLKKQLAKDVEQVKDSLS